MIKNLIQNKNGIMVSVDLNVKNQQNNIYVKNFIYRIQIMMMMMMMMMVSVTILRLRF